MGEKVSPGDHLRAELLRLGIDQVTLSTRVGVSRQTVNNIINGRQEISRAIAKKLGAVTGRPDDYWLRSSFAPFKPADTRRKSKVKESVTAPKKSAPQRAAPSPITFLDFAQKEGGDIAGALKTYPKLGRITTWSDLRRHIKAVDGNEDRLVEARALWRRYEALAKAGG